MGEVVRCELKERNAHSHFAVALKKAGIGTVGHQQAEKKSFIAMLLSTKISHLLAIFCVKCKTQKFLTKRYP